MEVVVGVLWWVSEGGIGEGCQAHAALVRIDHDPAKHCNQYRVGATAEAVQVHSEMYGRARLTTCTPEGVQNFV